MRSRRASSKRAEWVSGDHESTVRSLVVRCCSPRFSCLAVASAAFPARRMRGRDHRRFARARTRDRPRGCGARGAFGVARAFGRRAGRCRSRASRPRSDGAYRRVRRPARRTGLGRFRTRRARTRCRRRPHRVRGRHHRRSARRARVFRLCRLGGDELPRDGPGGRSRPARDATAAFGADRRDRVDRRPRPRPDALAVLREQVCGAGLRTGAYGWSSPATTSS